VTIRKQPRHNARSPEPTKLWVAEPKPLESTRR
jgi:hypothetical protein